MLKKSRIIDFYQQIPCFIKQNLKSDSIKLKKFKQKCDWFNHIALYIRPNNAKVTPKWEKWQNKIKKFVLVVSKLEISMLVLIRL